MSNASPIRTLVVIPARGGSKGLPGKNLLRVGGASLVHRAVRSSAQADLVDAVVVSTDDPAIASEASSSGARVITRPAELSGDSASSESALLHALDLIDAEQGVPVQVCVLVQCTSPFVSGEDIDGVVSLVVNGEAESAFTATDHHRFLWAEQHDGGLVGINHDLARRQRRQERRLELVETGGAYAMSANGLRSNGSRFFGRVAAHLVDASRSIEIDDESDYRLACAISPVIDSHRTPDLPDPLGAVVLDFDGVMTDDTALVLEDGTEGVLVHRGDGMGIGNLREAGVRVLVISKERNPVVARRCEKLQIEFLQGVDAKWPLLERWLDAHTIAASSVIYVGNDVNDLECLEHVGLAVAVADAHPEVIAVADLVLSRPGGNGAVRELSDRILEQRKRPVH